MRKIKSNSFDYGFYTDYRKECVERFGSIHDLPVIKKFPEEIKNSCQNTSILDVGAGKEKIFQKKYSINDKNYFSLDNDPYGKFTYKTLEDIPSKKTFGLIAANQFFEHLSIEESIAFIKKISIHMKPGGRFIATIPNVMHPVRYRGDVTHKTFWDYKALYVLLKYGNINTTNIYRYSKRYPQGLIEKILSYYINKIYRIDWCDSIMILGQKK